MKALYNFGIFLFSVLVHIVAPFSQKASLWVRGRRKWVEKAGGKITPGDRVVWVHCASLGEFEQGRPIIEAIKKEYPHYKIVLTFFSPSGYEIRKNYSLSDYTCYLPADTLRNAHLFVDLIKPELVIFVKYEFWNNFISVIHQRKIPLYLVSGIFRKEQHFFKWYGSFFREMLKKFTRIFVQDQASLDLLAGIGIKEVVLAGDTRFDRVAELAGTAREIPQVDMFRNNERLFLAGSSWKQDEEIIAAYVNENPDRMKWIFAPHEIDEQNIKRLERLFKTTVVRFSQLDGQSSGARVMIIDNIGMLSSAYRYAFIAAIGGGFGKGIHNILEPACWNIPVMFGPNFKKFREATDLIQAGGARSFSNYMEFRAILESWLDNPDLYESAAKESGNYVRKETGATPVIMEQIKLEDINNSY
jgi:3-deoxy-D-manno-octulosonic-acid transferase